MNRLLRLVSGGIAIPAMVAVGCATSVQTIVKTQGAADLDCPLELTTPWIADTEHFVVRGCGRERQYTCKLDASGKTACTPVGEMSLQPAHTSRPSRLSPASEFDLALGAVEQQILECRPSAHRLDVPYRVIADTSSDDIRVDGNENKNLEGAEAACVRSTLSRAGIPGKIPKIEGNKHWGKPFTFSKDRRRVPTAAVPPPAGSETPVTAESGAPAPTGSGAPAAPSRSAGADTVEARVRARIAENAEAIVACAGKSPVAVEVSYDAEGKLTLALRGAEHGSPAERCMTAALPSLAVEGGGSAGTLIHLVR
jgi:hypothetical protein